MYMHEFIDLYPLRAELERAVHAVDLNTVMKNATSTELRRWMELVESVRRETDATGKPFNVHVDPNGSEFKGAVNRSRRTHGESDIRGLIDDAGHLYVWDGYHAHHREMATMLGLSPDLVYATFSEGPPSVLSIAVWQGLSSRGFTAVCGAVEKYPRLQQALKFFKVHQEDCEPD
jgi:hypothetical protein